MGCAPRMAGCASTCGHREIVMAYREERQRLEDLAMEASSGYETELRDYLRDNPIGTFKDYLIHTRRDRDAMQPLPAVPVLVDHGMVPREPIARDANGQYTGPDPSLAFQFTTPADEAEVALLSTALATDVGVDALRAIDPVEFRDGRHENVARAILDLADGNLTGAERDSRLTRAEWTALGLPTDQLLPHGAEQVTSLLRERGQLPQPWDPTVPLRPTDPALYGLGAWETYAPPGVCAPFYAQEVRSTTQAVRLEEASIRSASRARAATELPTGEERTVTIREVWRQLQRELQAIPPTLQTDGPDPRRQRHEQALLHPPQLSAAGQQVLSRHGR